MDWSAGLPRVRYCGTKFIAAGIYGYQFANAAELMRGYPGFDLARFKKMMLTVVPCRKRVARTLSAGMSVFARLGGRLQVTEVNGQPGAVAYDSHDRLLGVAGLGIADGQIQTIHSIANPDKLRHLSS